MSSERIASNVAERFLVLGFRLSLAASRERIHWVREKNFCFAIYFWFNDVE